MRVINIPQPKQNFRYDEAMNTLRTNITFSGSKIQTVLITSVSPNEGKSSISWDLARSFANSGKRAIYVDTDMRKTVFMQRYGITQKVYGLSEYLSGQCEIDDAIYQSSIEGLDIVFAGPYSPNPTKLLEDGRCDEFFAAIKGRDYDFIIIDTAPLGTVIDAAILSKYSDGVAVVVESEVTTIKLLQKVQDQLEKTGARQLGIILNKVKMNKGGYYSSYYYKGGPDAYSAYEAPR
jgi:capsular exopolysaccharide synthesis family protein